MSVRFVLAAWAWLAASAQSTHAPKAPDSLIGSASSRYRSLYGEPEFRALDDEQARPWPSGRAIRTVGRLRESPQPDGYRSGDRHEAPRYELCGETHCIKVAPFEDVRDAVAAHFPFWVNRDVEVVGAYAGEESIGRGAPPSGFGIWQAHLMPEPAARRARPSELETLVRYPKGAEGRTVTVVGTFRGANLFGDLPDETRRDSGDWVLRDGPFSVWITGRPPKGDGWALDPRLRSDCTFRLQVRGVVETSDGYIYLRATSATVLRRARPEEALP